MFGKREQIDLNFGHVKLNIHANIFGIITNRIEVEYVVSKLMEWKYVGTREGTNKQANNDKKYSMSNFKKKQERRKMIQKKRALESPK